MKHVVVTGANCGIGLELARHYNAEGWHVTGVCRKTSSELGQVAAQIIEGNLNLSYISLMLTHNG